MSKTMEVSRDIIRKGKCPACESGRIMNLPTGRACKKCGMTFVIMSSKKSKSK